MARDVDAGPDAGTRADARGLDGVTSRDAVAGSDAGSEAGDGPESGLDAMAMLDADSADADSTVMDVPIGRDAGVDSGGPTTRDPRLQPFASNSIWNMPIGSGAVYVPANIRPVPGGGATIFALPRSDTDDFALTPTAPMIDVRYSSASWSGADRCPASTSEVLARVHVADGWLVPSSGYNEAWAFLDTDGRTLIQGEPLARCTHGGLATSLVRAPDGDLYGDGIVGGHGGSGMSTIGGTLRMGELRPGQRGPRHALKMTYYMKEAFRCSPPAQPCFRWPAPHADSYAVGFYGTGTDGSGTDNPNATNFAFRMGALLALPPDVDIASLGLRTEPARQLAWTLQNYGIYVDEDSYGPSIYLGTEYSPDGRFVDQFQTDYGFSFNQSSDGGSDWTHDFETLLPRLSIVDNNDATHVGGGGTPRQPLAPPIAP